MNSDNSIYYASQIVKIIPNDISQLIINNNELYNRLQC